MKSEQRKLINLEICDIFACHFKFVEIASSSNRYCQIYNHYNHFKILTRNIPVHHIAKKLNCISLKLKFYFPVLSPNTNTNKKIWTAILLKCNNFGSSSIHTGDKCTVNSIESWSLFTRSVSLCVFELSHSSLISLRSQNWNFNTSNRVCFK